METNLDKETRGTLGVGVEELEGALNDMLPGLTTYVRDVDLDPRVAELYAPGLVIRDKAPVDASCRVGGMIATHRFAILSNHMHDLTEYEHDTNWGLHVALPESRFKVVDVYEYEGKAQITLLHLLDDERWRLFEHAEFDMPGLNVEDIRARFRARCQQEPIPELATSQWLERCADPVGLGPAGELYAPDPMPAEAVWLVGETSFRALMDNVVFLAPGPDDDGTWLKAVPEEVEAGILAWPYIDCQCGLSFRYICPAAIDGASWVTHERDESLFAIIRAGALTQAIWCPTGIDPHAFERFTYEADEVYAPKNPAVLELRGTEFLDPIRHPLFPDDVQVLLLPSGPAKPELVWLRLCDLRDDTIFGTLLNEPEQDLGVHAGDVLPLAFQKDGERGIEAAVLLDEV